MAKIATSVRLEENLIKRLDAVAEARGQSRSELMEQILHREVKDEEKMLREMESNPIARMLLRTLMNNPAIVKVIMKLGGEKLTDENFKIGQKTAEHVLEVTAKRKAAKSTRAMPKLEAE